jgi:hypothetical protein
MAAMQEVGEDPDDSPPVGRRSARARGRAIEESDPSDEEGGAHFVRRSSRAAKPVARLSPDWKGDGEEDEEDETDDEGEYVDESETSEPDPDEEDDAEPKRYSRRERTTIQRYSPPKPAERGGSAEDNAGGARGRGRPAGGGKHASKHASKNGGGFKRANRRGDDDAAPRRGHRWMDDTDDSDVDGETDAFGGAPTLGFPGGGGSLNPWGGAAQNPYPLAPSSYGGGVLPGGGGAAGGWRERGIPGR